MEKSEIVKQTYLTKDEVRILKAVMKKPNAIYTDFGRKRRADIKALHYLEHSELLKSQKNRMNPTESPKYNITDKGKIALRFYVPFETLSNIFSGRFTDRVVKYMYVFGSCTTAETSHRLNTPEGT